MRESMLECKTCKTEKEYLAAVLVQYLGFYIGTASVMWTMSLMSTAHAGQYWKYVILFAVASLEALMLVRSDDPLKGWFFSWRTTGERITILRTISVALYMGVSQLGPLYFPASADAKNFRRLLTEMDNVSNMQAKESHLAFKNAFDPFASDPSASAQLQRRMEKLALDTRLESEFRKKAQ